MTALVVVGAQWGDEAKGKIVDHLAGGADVVVRYGGGPNAGHTLVVGGEKLVLRLVPSGILRPGKLCVLGQGMVIDAAQLTRELDELAARGHVTQGRLLVSDRAHLILPHHIAADGLRESSAAPGKAIGTTKRGIGPAYEDKVARRGLRAGDLRDMQRVESVVRATLEAWVPFFASHHVEVPPLQRVLDELHALAPRIVPLLADVSALLDAQLRAGARVLLEGAQGTLLDVDHGTYPFVTSSSSTAGGACVGAGIGPRAVSRVVGITKAYATRVGEGPFPTELHDEAGAHLQSVGMEVGSVTGRARRTGWLDVPALRYAARVSGFDALALTKLDVLTGLDPIRVCVAYDTPRGRVDVLPSEYMDCAEKLKPVYQDVPGWKKPMGNATSLADLPGAARSYLQLVEQLVGVSCDLVSVGAAREATIPLHSSW